MIMHTLSSRAVISAYAPNQFHAIACTFHLFVSIVPFWLIHVWDDTSAFVKSYLICLSSPHPLLVYRCGVHPFLGWSNHSFVLRTAVFDISSFFIPSSLRTSSSRGVSCWGYIERAVRRYEKSSNRMLLQQWQKRWCILDKAGVKVSFMRDAFVIPEACRTENFARFNQIR